MERPGNAGELSLRNELIRNELIRNGRQVPLEEKGRFLLWQPGMCHKVAACCNWQSPNTADGRPLHMRLGWPRRPQTHQTPHEYSSQIPDGFTSRRNNLLTDAIMPANVCRDIGTKCCDSWFLSFVCNSEIKEVGGLSTFGKWMKNLPDNAKHTQSWKRRFRFWN